MGFGILSKLNEEQDGLKPLETKVEPKNDIVEEEKVATEPISTETIENQPTEEQKSKSDIVEKPELDDNSVLNYFNTKNNTKFNSIEEYQNSFIKEVEKPVEKEVNPYEDLMDEEDKAYFNYKKETGRSRKEFDFLAQDFSSKSALELSIEKVKNDTGLKLNNSEAKEFLEKKLGIDLEGELSTTDKIELNAYVKPYRDSLIEQQDKYRAPLEDALKQKKSAEPITPMYTLQSGEQGTAEQYQEEQDKIQEDYIENITKGASSAAPSEFNIEIDNNGDKLTLNFKYEYSDADKQSMLSDASNVDAMLEKRYKTEEGFDHSRLVKGLWWGDEKNQQKVIAAAMQQARAEAYAEIEARNNNENFSRKPIHKSPKTKEGYGQLPTGTKKIKTFGVNGSIAS